MAFEQKLVDRLMDKLDAEEERMKDRILAGNLTDFGQYERAHGHLKAIADCKTLLNETFEELMKE